MRDRELGEKASQLDAAREVIRGNAPRAFALDGRSLSGDYNKDIEDVLSRLEVEAKRSEFLENQNRTLITQLESSDNRTAEVTANAADLREKLARQDDGHSERQAELVEAEARIADAENRVSVILAQTTRLVEDGEQKHDMLLAEKLGIEEEMEKLRGKVSGVEQTVMADWDTDRIEQSHLRERLNDIASDVSRLVYALEGNGLPDSEESLLDRVQKFADLPEDTLPTPVRGPNARPPEGAVSDRLKALRELQEGN